MAWPARQTERVGPWLLRSTAGFTRRANSVAVLGPCPRHPLRAVEHAERFYRSHAQPARFQIADTDRTAPLRILLAERGYQPGPPTAVLLGPAPGSPSAAAPANSLPNGQEVVALDEAPPPSWFDLWWSVDGRGDEHRSEAAALLTRIPGPKAFASVPDRARGTQPVSVALGVVAGDLLGLFCAVTRPEARGRRLSHRVADALGGWAVSNGAEKTYVQVATSNPSSLRLSTRLGFEPIYEYRYWQKS